MECEYCLIKEQKKNILYQDKEVVVALRDNVLTPGQISVFPAEHFTILEMVPKKILEKCAVLANKVSIAAFEGLGSAGTNILINNGLGAKQDIPHFGIEIIPRIESDGLNLMWEPTPLMEDELEMSFENISEFTKDMSLEDIKVSPAKETKSEPAEDSKEPVDNYLLKSQRRIP